MNPLEFMGSTVLDKALSPAQLAQRRTAAKSNRAGLSGRINRVRGAARRFSRGTGGRRLRNAVIAGGLGYGGYRRFGKRLSSAELAQRIRAANSPARRKARIDRRIDRVLDGQRLLERVKLTNGKTRFILRPLTDAERKNPNLRRAARAQYQSRRGIAGMYLGMYGALALAAHANQKDMVNRQYQYQNRRPPGSNSTFTKRASRSRRFKIGMAAGLAAAGLAGTAGHRWRRSKPRIIKPAGVKNTNTRQTGRPARSSGTASAPNAGFGALGLPPASH